MLSAQEGEVSGANSLGILTAVTEVVNDIFQVEINDEQILNVHNFARKIAHFSIYAALAIFAYNMFRQLIEQKQFIFAVTLIFCILIAVSDEIHQIFIPDRSAEIRDVLIDTLGACVGLALVWLVSTVVKKIKKSINKINKKKDVKR